METQQPLLVVLDPRLALGRYLRAAAPAGGAYRYASFASLADALLSGKLAQAEAVVVAVDHATNDVVSGLRARGYTGALLAVSEFTLLLTRALRQGADRAVELPIDANVILALVGALKRRIGWQGQRRRQVPLAWGGYVARPPSIYIETPSGQLRLTPRSLEFFLLLLRAKGRLVPNAHFWALIDGDAGDDCAEAARVNINYLRRRFRAAGYPAGLIQCEFNQGYRLLAPDDPRAQESIAQPSVQLRPEDMPKIRRLRAAGYYWEQIKRDHFPKVSTESLRVYYLRSFEAEGQEPPPFSPRERWLPGRRIILRTEEAS